VTELEKIDLITCGGATRERLMLNIVVGGKTMRYSISRKAAASAVGRIAETLAVPIDRARWRRLDLHCHAAEATRMTRYEFHGEDRGLGRVYYTTRNAKGQTLLCCIQNDASGTPEFYRCSRNGEPDYPVKMPSPIEFDRLVLP